MEPHLSPWEVAAAEVRLTPWYLVKHPVTWVSPLVVFASGVSWVSGILLVRGCNSHG